MKSPSIPVIKNIGVNANAVVTTVVMTGFATDEAPSTAASSGAMPCSRHRQIFSATTIPSSTTMPMMRIIAPIAMVSRNAPNIGSRNNVPSSTTGMLKATQNAECQLRNIDSMSMTRPRPIRPFDSTTLRRFLTR